MKAFFNKILTFISYMMIIFFTFLVINYFIIDKNALTFDKKIEVLILGDSNTECAIIDSLQKNVINLSKSGSSYFYSYLKLKKIIENCNVDTLILSFAPHNIDKRVEKEWLFNTKFLFSNFGRYYPLMSLSDFFVLFKKNPDGIIGSIPGIIPIGIMNIISYLSGDSINDQYGGYQRLDGTNRNFKTEKAGFDSTTTFFISHFEIDYLNKIVNLCQDKKIKMYFINTPKFKKQYRPDSLVRLYEKIYLNQFIIIPLLDYSNFVLSDKGFKDSMHLNYYGATIFTTEISKSGWVESNRLKASSDKAKIESNYAN